MRKLLLSILLLVISLSVKAQMPEPLPMDSQVRFGKLENGLTYYIRANAYPEKQADFYIAQRVGSMQEEDSQQGLAHFLEHMAFNGTKHFPGKKDMLNYLESVGAKFGVNINAYTGFDQTVYNLSNIPVIREGIIDSCLLVLHDWSGYILLKDEMVDEERKVIKEEWRTSNNAQRRTMEAHLPVMYKDSKYAYRMPIGTMEVVEGFEYQTLKDYYHKWYRPDLQAIIIVGDIDVDQIEAKIKSMFAHIPLDAERAERVDVLVPDNKEPLISVVTDKENTNSRVTLYHKHDILPNEIKNTEIGLMLSYVKNLASSMMSDRLNEIGQDPDAPFMHAGAWDGTYFASESKDAWTLVAISKEGKTEESLAVLARENERVKRFGFTETEVERAKAKRLRDYENFYNNRNKRLNDSYVQEYVANYTSGEPIPGIEYEYEFVKKIDPMVSADVINQFMANLIGEENVVVTIGGPEKEELTYPTEANVLATLTNASKETLEAYAETLSDEPLISKMPKAGKVVKTVEDKELGSTLWTLSNGMKVAYKITDFKDDQILMSSNSKGGTSLIGIEDRFSAEFASMVPYVGGIGNFSSTDLKKTLAGKTANVSVSFGMYGQSLAGHSSIKDLETMLQLAYLHFTAPRKDEKVWASISTMVREQLKNKSKNPSSAFSDAITEATYNNNPFMIPMEEEDMDKVDYDKAIAIYKQLLANPGSFVFSFIGNVDPKVLKPLVEQYLGSLPSGNVDANYKDLGVEIRKGEFKNRFEQEMSNPKASAYNLYSGTLKRDLKNQMSLDALKQILDIVYVRTVREEVGGTYGVGVGASISRIPMGETRLLMKYDTDPERADVINPIIGQDFANIANNGPEAADFQKVKEYMLKSLQEDVKDNWYWQSVINTYYFYGDNQHSTRQGVIESLTAADVQEVAKKLLDQGNVIEVMMMPVLEPVVEPVVE